MDAVGGVCRRTMRLSVNMLSSPNALTVNIEGVCALSAFVLPALVGSLPPGNEGVVPATGTRPIKMSMGSTGATSYSN